MAHLPVTGTIRASEVNGCTQSPAEAIMVHLQVTGTIRAFEVNGCT